MVDFVAWHDRTRANHDAETTRCAALGYRTTSLSVYGDRNDPRYAAVMVKRPVVHAELQFSGLSKFEFSQQTGKLSLQKLQPYLVSATGPADDPLIAVSYRPNAETVVNWPALDEQFLRQQMTTYWRNGRIPISLDAYGTPDNLRFIGLWALNTDRMPWNYESMAGVVDSATMQARYNAMVAAWGRMADIVMAPGGKYLGLYVNRPAGGSEAQANLTSAAYQAFFNQQTAQGRYPARVTAEGVGANARFSAIFNGREGPTGRALVPTGPKKIAAIDSAIFKFMAAHDMRGVALAIVSDTRLVYARGYRYAEEGYPDVQPTTLFRQASVSKLFAAAAVRKLIQDEVRGPDGKVVTLNTEMQSILKLKTPAGKDPADPRFGTITIRHLLESNASLNEGLIFADVAAAQSFGSKLPATADQLASYAASLTLGAKNPGDPTNTVYGNSEYFLLSQVIKVLAKAKDFESALKTIILDPLGIKRVRGSISLLGNQAADEARYHEVNVRPMPKKPGEWYDYWQTLGFGPSSQAENRAVVPDQYGVTNYEVCDGCGGLSAAVTDIARLVACLNLQTGNPLFTQDTLKNWFSDVVAASAHTGPDAHGYHGFDGGRTDTSKSILDPWNFVASKGGWLPSHSSVVTYYSGGLSFIIAANSVGQSDVKTDWFVDLAGDAGDQPDPGSVWAIAAARDWSKDEDLFDFFGMPGFKTSVVKSGTLSLHRPPPPLATEAMVRNSSVRQIKIGRSLPTARR